MNRSPKINRSPRTLVLLPRCRKSDKRNRGRLSVGSIKLGVALVSTFISLGAANWAAGLGVALLGLTVAKAQTGPLGASVGLGNDVVTAEDAMPYRKTIQEYVAAQLRPMIADDRGSLARVRDELVNTATTTAPPRSPAFLAMLAGELDAQLRPALPAMSPAARLNAAIVVARLARVSKAVELHKVIEALIADEAPAVSMWGMQASRYVLPVVLSHPVLANNNRILANTSAAVRAHQEQGPLAAEAYRSLLAEMEAMSQVRDPRQRVEIQVVMGTIAPAVIDGVHDLLAARLAIYDTGAIPNDPYTDYADGVRVLALPFVWRLQTPQQQSTTMLRVNQLLDVSRKNLTNSDPALVMQFRELAKGLGSVAGAIDPALPNAAELNKAGQALNRIGPAVPVAQVEQLINSVTAAIPKVFPDAVERPAPTPQN